jgi:type 1 fimbriae regulatory protein FimB
MKALTQEELDWLLASTPDAKLHGMCLLGFSHGMRASEVCALKWTDVNLETGTITVRRGKHSLTNKQPLTAEETEILKTLWEASTGSPYVFPSLKTWERGKRGRMSRWAFWHQFKAACLRAGIPPDKAHPHVLKHSLGRALVKANVNMAVIKQALGHRSITSTAVYTEMDDETVGKIVQEALSAD